MLAVTTAPLASVLEGSGDIWLSIQGEILIIIGETVSKKHPVFVFVTHYIKIFAGYSS